MQLIERVELTSSAASITFSNIPQDGTDLYILVSDRSNRTGATNDGLLVKPNGTSLTRRWLYGIGSSVNTGTTDFDTLNNSNSTTANTYSNIAIYIPNYASTTQYKSVSIDGVTENNATDAIQVITAGLYSSNTAITSITLSLLVGTEFLSGSSASLYLIRKGSDGIVTVS